MKSKCSKPNWNHKLQVSLQKSCAKEREKQIAGHHHIISMVCTLMEHSSHGVVIKSRGPGILPGYWGSGPRLLLLENRRKIEAKEIPSRLIPRLLVVFTRQLEILVTTLLSTNQHTKTNLRVPDNQIWHFLSPELLHTYLQLHQG